MEQPIRIRPIEPGDAERFLQLCRSLDQQTRTMLLEPDERCTTVAEQAATIQTLLDSSNQTILVAEQAGALVGYIAAYGGQYRRTSHSALIVIGILPALSGQGIGTRLFAALELWARRQGLHRLELTVMVHNQAAIGLYTKVGFAIEGRLRHAIRLDGAYIDEYSMAKLLT